ncbi:SDR family NAD(P)-dependent oxidoreductase [Chishuiella sp.]|uniref:SDR family NAD(P)-dependent oxidoreductase n=1 Tax=Chishuiella sp. TaxID=1969467 RepID=UPI0028B0B3D0|nr:SDR family NAD(P)-dependent oxidoreductase [Chishuiella sp.]
MKNTKKIILITGSTQGLGKITATELAKEGHQIIIHGRNKNKLEKVRNKIIQITGNNNIDIIVADLLSLEDTVKMSNEIITNYDKLDILINNAGAFFNKNREETEEGFEKTITLNLFAPFILMKSLADLLAKSDEGRIINLSSAMHKRGGKPNFSDFQLKNDYKPDKAYGLSKLYLIWISRHMVSYLKDRGINNVTVNVCHPGAAATNFGQDADKGFLFNLIFKVALLVMDKPEKGAMTSIYLASSPDVKNVTGQFFGNRNNIQKPDDRYYSKINEQKVWDYCIEITKKYL